MSSVCQAQCFPLWLVTVPLTDTMEFGDPDPAYVPQSIDMRCIGGANRICETLFPRAGVVGITGPFYHISGFAVRAQNTLFLFGFMCVVYSIVLAVLVTQDLYGADLDTIYWIAPGHCSPLLCMH